MRALGLSLVLVMATASTARATDYFVDDVGGADTNSGTAQNQAWRSLAPVNSASFSPGDTISFRRGGQWTEGLHVRQSGTAGSPITFTAYGTGADPILEAPGGDPWANAIRVEGQAYIVISHVLVRNGPEGGINIQSPSHDVVVRDCEATDVGIGVMVGGSNNRVTSCYFHDLHMVRNTPPPDDNDDYGAVGVTIVGSGHEIDHNRFEHCIAPSYDYGTDGGAVEFWSDVQDCFIHHNVAHDTNGFAEIGGQSGDQNHDNVLAYNVVIDTYGFGYYHMSGTFGVDLAGLRIENNTIVERTDNWAIIGFSDTPTSSTATVRNNIVVTNGDRIANYDGFTHDHNLYWLTDGGDVGFTLGDGESVEDPLFVDPTTPDVHLQATSPAIDQGVDLGYTEDVEGHPVPQGAAPDLGAMEYGDTGVGGGAGSGGSGGNGAAQPDAGPGGGGTAPVDAAPGPEDDSGCGCRTAGRPTLPSSAPAVLGLLMLLSLLWLSRTGSGSASAPGRCLRNS